MSLLNEEEVFQKADNDIRDWKNRIRFRYIVHPCSMSIRSTIGWSPPITNIDTPTTHDMFLKWIDKHGCWIELEKIINQFDFVNYAIYVDSQPKNQVYYFKNSTV